MASNNPMDKAEKAFKKEEQRREGAKNLAAYQQAEIEQQKKTERLRALRLAHEAEQAAAEAEKPKAAPKKKPARKKVAQPAL